MLRLFLGGLVVLASCYGHRVGPSAADRPRSSGRPDLMGPGSGVYRIERDGRLAGEETFSIRVNRQVWRAEGVIRWAGAAARSEGYWLEFDVARAEPRGLELFVDLVGERRTVQGEVRSGYLETTGAGPGGPARRRVPYAPGTNVEFASPLFKVPMMSLLGPGLEIDRPVFVRTIVFSMPRLLPQVELVRLLFRERRAAARLVVFERRGTPAPLALWVRPDGLVTRLRTWPRGASGPRMEWKLTRWTPLDAPAND